MCVRSFALVFTTDKLDEKSRVYCYACQRFVRVKSHEARVENETSRGPIVSVGRVREHVA